MPRLGPQHLYTFTGEIQYFEINDCCIHGNVSVLPAENRDHLVALLFFILEMLICKMADRT